MIKMDNVQYSTLLGAMGEYQTEQVTLDLVGTVLRYESGQNFIVFKHRISGLRPGTYSRVRYKKSTDSVWYPLEVYGYSLNGFDQGATLLGANTGIFQGRDWVEVWISVSNGVLGIDYTIPTQSFQYVLRFFDSPISATL